MKINSIFRISALLAVLALAATAFAKPVSKTISITQTAKVGTVSLDAGSYRFVIDGNKATVEKDGHKIAESTGRWEDRDSKSQYDSVLLGADGHVQEVRFSGKNRVFVFSE
ncbi:MAG TPA: hypothetical protein VLX32_10925 [Candidatus Acidoferrum sp.]|nr:hypothetical protein [Candidatus Acidoferrum sp.]